MTAPGPDHPNLVVIFSDQQHWNAAGCRDPHFVTPAMDRFASQAVSFGQVYCTTPLCSPSRATMLTGKYPTHHGVTDNGVPLRQPTIAPLLQRAGYRTAYFGKWHLRDQAVAVAGWDEQQGVCDEYHAPNRPLGDHETERFALEFLDRGGREPFALFVSFDEPHGIYCFTPGIYPADHAVVPAVRPGTRLPRSWYDGGHAGSPMASDARAVEQQTRALKGAGEEAWKSYRELYRDRVAAYDARLAKVLARLEQAGQLDRSVVVVTSDHGDMDTYHRLIYKGPFMYDHVQRVPLLVRIPGALGGTGARQDEASLVSNVDLAPTLLDLAGVGAVATDGISLVPVLTGREGVHRREEVVVQYAQPPIRTLRDRRWKYTLYRDRGEELYDVAGDPGELRNLAGEAAFVDVCRTMRQRLESWMRAARDPF